MADLIINGVKHELQDGSPIRDVCEQEGVSFNCNTGICGSCQVRVVEGTENLSEVTQEEMDLGLDENTRLSCMCRIMSGLVKIEF